MKIIEHTFLVETRVEFNRDELDRMFEASENHYDVKCRMASKPGGFLWGMLTVMQRAEDDGLATAEYTLSSDRLDTLCKILESPLAPMDLQNRVQEILRSNIAEGKRVNQIAKDEQYNL